MSKLNVKIKKLVDEAKVPEYSQNGDAGLDLTAVNVSYSDDYIEYSTGLALEIPEGYVGLVFPRSSISKLKTSLCNSVGVIDSNYRGEVKLRFRNFGSIYTVGERIGQLIIMPYPEVEFNVVDELGDTNRGSGGFGSSGA
jgi:dUTP pyrophosphatase